MCTSFSILALAGFLVQAAPPNVVWWRDYTVAQQKGVNEQKPLAIFVGTGPGGYRSLASGEELSEGVKQILADNYICVYLDNASANHTNLIKKLEITKGHGLVLSDRSGAVQAFHHDGQVTEANLLANLRHFATPGVDIRTTISNTVPTIAPTANPATANQRLSYYYDGSSYSVDAPVYRPSYSPSYTPSFTPAYSPATSTRNC